MRHARDRGRRPAPAVVLIVTVNVLALGLGACSSDGGNHSPPADAASEAPSSDAPAEVAPTAYTCQNIRTCVAACADAACLDACKARGTTDAQAIFASLQQCLATLDQQSPPGDNCTGVDPGCYCREECDPDGYCLDQVAACLSASPADANDTVCNGTCLP